MRMRSQDGSVRILLLDDEAEDGLIAIEKMGEFATRYCGYGYSHAARERHSSPKIHLCLLPTCIVIGVCTGNDRYTRIVMEK
jgi:hypothetical protein